jgi:aspartokinase/homoserine dehydrogenase 1
MKTSSKKHQAIESLCDGVGNVGEIYRTDTPTKEILKDTLRINLRVIALSNSRKMYFDEDGFH